MCVLACDFDRVDCVLMLYDCLCLCAELVVLYCSCWVVCVLVSVCLRRYAFCLSVRCERLFVFVCGFDWLVNVWLVMLIGLFVCGIACLWPCLFVPGFLLYACLCLWAEMDCFVSVGLLAVLNVCFVFVFVLYDCLCLCTDLIVLLCSFVLVCVSACACLLVALIALFVCPCRMMNCFCARA